jgi:hypothetical protein
MGTLVALKVKPGGYMESQSGLARSNPQIFCRFEAPVGDNRDVAFVVVHPTSNFHAHYLIDPIVSRGAAILALNTRYVGSDTMLLMERAIQDLGAGIRFLRERGYRRVVLIGNSGGGSLAAFYQQQAERLTVSTTPDGEPFDIVADDLPPADTIALIAAHPGRASQLACKIDPSAIDESDPRRTDPALDMFNPDNGPAYSPTWMAAYREAQIVRLKRIVDKVEDRFRTLKQERGAALADEAFLVHRTQADPRTVDLSLDPSDRAVGTLGGEARAYNYAGNGLARFCTSRSFLSQWSPWHTRAEGPRCLSETSVDVLILDHTGDQTVFPSQVRQWRDAAGARQTYVPVHGAPHYLSPGSKHLDLVADTLADWGRRA